MTGPIAGLVAAAVAAAAAVVLHRARRHRAIATTLIAGPVLALLGIAGGLWLLPVSNAPRPSLGAVGFVPPQPPKVGRGFAVGVGVHVHGCSNPVDVAVVVSGTAEYWTDHPPPPRAVSSPSPFTLVLPGTGLADLHVGLAAADTDLTTPQQAAFSRKNAAEYLHSLRVVASRGNTHVSGTIDYWKEGLFDVIAAFRANWLSRRGLSSCYLQLPVLSGPLTEAAAFTTLTHQQRRQYPTKSDFVKAGSAPYLSQLELTNGLLAVTVDGGQVDPADSLPPPVAVVDGDPAWSCRSPNESVGLVHAGRELALPNILVGRVGAAFSESLIEQNAAGNCRGVAVITQDSAAYSRDLVLLAVGAVTSLGITLLIQGSLDWLSGKGEPDGDGDAEPSPAGRP